MPTSQKLQNIFTGVALASLTALMTVSGTFAADEGSVTATVTAQNIAVSVSDGSVAYGTIGLSSTRDTTSDEANDSQTATNDGNITVNLNIRDLGETDAWDISSTAGADEYVHAFCTTTCDSSPTWTPLTDSNQTLATGVTASGTQVFDLRLSTPTSTSSYAEQSLTVTVQASI